MSSSTVPQNMKTDQIAWGLESSLGHFTKWQHIIAGDEPPKAVVIIKLIIGAGDGLCCTEEAFLLSTQQPWL